MFQVHTALRCKNVNYEKFGKLQIRNTSVLIQTAFISATILLFAVAIVPIKGIAEPLPLWVAGRYDGIFAAPPAKCTNYPELHEPMPFTLSLRSRSIRIQMTSPFGRRIIFQSPLIRNKLGVVLKGTFQTIESNGVLSDLGSGPFSGRIFLGDHALIIVTFIRPAHAPNCKMAGILSGIRRPLKRLDQTF